MDVAVSLSTMALPLRLGDTGESDFDAAREAVGAVDPEVATVGSDERATGPPGFPAMT